MAKQQSLATKEESALAIPLEELQADAGAGSEEVRSEDIQIPSLVIVQKMSPQVEASHAAFLPDAKVGMICDTLTGQLFDGEKGIEVVPVYFRPVVNHMKVDGEQAEYIAEYAVTDPFVKQRTQRDEKNRDMLLDDPGTFLQHVAQQFVLLVDTGTPFVIRMKRTAIRPSKRWNALLDQYKPVTLPDGTTKARPRFSIVTPLRTVNEEKDGKVWKNWSLGDLRELEDVALYRKAKTLAALIREGHAVAAPEEPDTEAPTEEVPF